MSTTIYISNTPGGRTQLFALEPTECLTVQLDDQLPPIYGEIKRIENAPFNTRKEVANMILRSKLEAPAYNNTVTASASLVGGYMVQFSDHDGILGGICHFKCDVASNGGNMQLVIFYKRQDCDGVNLAYLIPSFGKIGDIYDRFIADLIAVPS